MSDIAAFTVSFELESPARGAVVHSFQIRVGDGPMSDWGSGVGVDHIKYARFDIQAANVTDTVRVMIRDLDEPRRSHFEWLVRAMAQALDNPAKAGA